MRQFRTDVLMSQEMRAVTRQPEKRRTQRIELSLAGSADLGLAERKPTKKFTVTTRNVCADGAYLVSSSEPETGTEIQLHLEWPYGVPQEKRSLEALGEILRVERISESEYGFAVHFRDVPLIVDRASILPGSSPGS